MQKPPASPVPSPLVSARLTPSPGLQALHWGSNVRDAKKKIKTKLHLLVCGSFRLAPGIAYPSPGWKTSCYLLQSFLFRRSVAGALASAAWLSVGPSWRWCCVECRPLALSPERATIRPERRGLSIESAERFDVRARCFVYVFGGAVDKRIAVHR